MRLNAENVDEALSAARAYERMLRDARAAFRAVDTKERTHHTALFRSKRAAVAPRILALKGWIDHDGGELPIDGSMHVIVEYTSGIINGGCRAIDHCWVHHEVDHVDRIIRYRVTV
jgi:hypothetical protein